MAKVTLHYVEFCMNNIGVWDRSWRATKKEIKAEFKRLKDEGCSTDTDNGEWGSLNEPDTVDVKLTPEGVLEFARNFAVDSEA